MSTRFCTSCATEVEDADGFCLLGHSLRVSPITDSMDELRAEVDHAFAAARAELASINGRRPAATPQRPPAPPAPTGRPEHALTAPAPTRRPESALTAPAPTGRPETGPAAPPPPPPSDYSETTIPSVWQAFEHELAGAEGRIDSGDPISMFAPSPRMDWGPERLSVLKRPTFRRPSGASA